ncbi:hypothetical protein CBR_g49490 [Chara braunii]|uniref:Uncharacterized protein n=1 Tax=Chara braunii TaxID=69332 RepID=A0A388K502_CHABU|nr:hypothetical protein CBR_g49490 [Chara braunii]|eukprot:GBG65127.1 hypothetical protein CBR_g49490 [Chara braunii]
MTHFELSLILEGDGEEEEEEEGDGGEEDGEEGDGGEEDGEEGDGGEEEEEEGNGEKEDDDGGEAEEEEGDGEEGDEEEGDGEEDEDKEEEGEGNGEEEEEEEEEEEVGDGEEEDEDEEEGDGEEEEEEGNGEERVHLPAMAATAGRHDDGDNGTPPRAISTPPTASLHTVLGPDGLSQPTPGLWAQNCSPKPPGFITYAGPENGYTRTRTRHLRAYVCAYAEHSYVYTVLAK